MLGVEGIAQDEPLRTSLAEVDRGLTQLWLDGTAKDFAGLREFGELERLQLYRLPKRHVPVLAGLRLPRLRSLNLRHADAEDLTFLCGFAGLETLAVWQCPKMRRLDGLERLAGLRNLALNDLGAIDSLEQLSALGELRSLALTGGIWTKQGLPSLRPLRALERLAQLNLVAAQVIDGDLGPIADLPRLTRLDLSPRHFAPDQLARVAAAHPSFLADLLELPDFDNWEGAPGCKSCKSQRKIMFLRRKKLLWCPRCEKTKLDGLIEGFKQLVAAHRPSAR